MLVFYSEGLKYDQSLGLIPWNRMVINRGNFPSVPRPIESLNATIKKFKNYLYLLDMPYFLKNKSIIYSSINTIKKIVFSTRERNDIEFFDPSHYLFFSCVQNVHVAFKHLGIRCGLQQRIL